MQKESVSKQGRKSAKAEPSVHKDPLFNGACDDTIGLYGDLKCQDVRRTEMYTDRPNISTDRPKVSTDKEKDSTVSPNEGTVDQPEGRRATPTTPTTTPTIFGDYENTYFRFSQHEPSQSSFKRKGERRLRILIQKDKGKKKNEDEDESDTQSEGIPKAEKKFKQLARDEEMARKAALSNEYDFIQARMEADRLLALRLQEEEREQFTMEERAKFLHDTIAAQRRFDESFIAVGSTKDERKIKEMNEGAKDLEHKRLKKKVAKETLKKEDTAKVPAKIDVTKQGTIDSEIMENKSFISKFDEVSSPEGDYLVIYRANGNFRAFNYLLESDQQDWKIVTWRLYEACGVYIPELEDGTVIHMLVERRYPFSKDLLQRMLDLRLEVERESIAALDLIRFIKQQIDEN
ncbi:hypothetical protein Tco_1285132 [Tanacetum coccineum]